MTKMINIALTLTLTATDSTDSKADSVPAESSAVLNLAAGAKAVAADTQSGWTFGAGMSYGW